MEKESTIIIEGQRLDIPRKTYNKFNADGLNEELLEVVIAHMEKFPHTFDMDNWFDIDYEAITAIGNYINENPTRNYGDTFESLTKLKEEAKIDFCGSTACICGTAALYADPDNFPLNTRTSQSFIFAKERPKENVDLFIPGHWPIKYVYQINVAESNKEKTDVAIAAIRSYIDTGMWKKCEMPFLCGDCRGDHQFLDDYHIEHDELDDYFCEDCVEAIKLVIPSAT